MNLIFNILCITHVLIWIFILFAFINRETAEINLYYVIPIIYILHFLPFHILTSLKEYVEPENTFEKVKEFENGNLITKCYHIIKNYLNFCYFNPLTPQGMMILGAISSAWTIKLNQ